MSDGYEKHLENLRAAAKAQLVGELAEMRSAHNAELSQARAAHDERVRELGSVLRSALEQHSRRAPAIMRQLNLVDEALR
jgi:hypothetical protein